MGIFVRLLILLLSMPFSSSATVAETLGKLALEDVELAVRSPSRPWGLSPGLEISEGLELASELVGADVTGDLVSEGVDAEAEDCEVEVRENFTLLSPPHLEDPLLVLIFVTGFGRKFSSSNISVSAAAAPRRGFSSMALCPLPSGASPTASGTTCAVSPSNMFSPCLSSPGRCPLMTTGAGPPTA